MTSYYLLQEGKKGILPWIVKNASCALTHYFNACTSDNLHSVFSLSIIVHLNNGNSLHSQSIQVNSGTDTIRFTSKKGKRKLPGSATITNRSSSQTRRGRGNRQKPNERKSNKRMKSTKISSLFPKRGNRNAKRTEKHKNKITQGKT